MSKPCLSPASRGRFKSHIRVSCCQIRYLRAPHARKIQIPDWRYWYKSYIRELSRREQSRTGENIDGVCSCFCAEAGKPQTRSFIKTQTEQQANHYTTTTFKQNVYEKSTRRSNNISISPSQQECITIFSPSKKNNKQQQFNDKKATQIYQARTTISV
jgi:hypothetical protein